ncbi:MAG: hypothetical protein ACXAAT_08500 [Candidatus Hodarchaeales archaeon]|jgi:hypothetical protein
MNQKYMLSGILLLGLLIWGYAALAVTGNMGIIPMFEKGNYEEHHGMYDDDSGHHEMMGMMHGDDHGVEECEEYDLHLEEGYDCENYDSEEYCNQTTNHMDC